MWGLVDSLGEVVGPVLALLIVLHLIVEVLQTRYLKERISGVRSDLSDVATRVRRLETQQMEADGGKKKDE